MNIYADKQNAAVRRVWAREMKPSKQVTGKLKERKCVLWKPNKYLPQGQKH